jgi:hypothetical protein
MTPRAIAIKPPPIIGQGGFKPAKPLAHDDLQPADDQ